MKVHPTPELTSDHITLAMEHQQLQKTTLLQAIHLGQVKSRQLETERGFEMTL
jgi:hypothetical protein